MGDRAVVGWSSARRSRSPSLACKLSGRPGQGLTEEQPGDFECLLLRDLDAPDAMPLLIEK